MSTALPPHIRYFHKVCEETLIAQKFECQGESFWCNYVNVVLVRVLSLFSMNRVVKRAKQSFFRAVRAEEVEVVGAIGGPRKFSIFNRT